MFKLLLKRIYSLIERTFKTPERQKESGSQKGKKSRISLNIDGNDMYNLTYFTEDELRCNGSGQFVLADGFGERLDELRKAYNFPMVVTSCCRSFEYNKQIGGHPNSSHVFDHPQRSFKGTYGIDIYMNDGYRRGLLIRNALELGWCVGVAKTFIHLDRRCDYFPEYPQVVFTY